MNSRAESGASWSTLAADVAGATIISAAVLHRQHRSVNVWTTAPLCAVLVLVAYSRRQHIKGRTELSRVVEIDRRERVNVLYDQHGKQLVARYGNWSASPCDPDRHGQHSVEAQVHTLQHYANNGGVRARCARQRAAGWNRCRRAFGTVPRIAQLASLHGQLGQIAHTASDSDMIVSARPSENTVRSISRLSMADPVAELFEVEPEDVHMRKML